MLYEDFVDIYMHRQYKKIYMQHMVPHIYTEYNRNLMLYTPRFMEYRIPHEKVIWRNAGTLTRMEITHHLLPDTAQDLRRDIVSWGWHRLQSSVTESVTDEDGMESATRLSCG